MYYRYNYKFFHYVNKLIFIFQQVLSFRPPLCISYEDVELTVNVLETVFVQHMKKRHRSWRSSEFSGRGNY